MSRPEASPSDVPSSEALDRFPPLVLDGWYLLHQFVRLRPGARPGLSTRLTALAGYLEAWSEGEAETPDAEGRARGWSGVYRIVGGGTDLMLLHLRPSLAALGDAEAVLRRLGLDEDLEPTSDYLSAVELGLYAVTDALLTQARGEGVHPGTPEWDARVRQQLEAEREKRYVRARLCPIQPEDMPHVCFYPMDKRRNVGQNWYTLPLAERAALMSEHGRTGRRYAGRVSQIISGSVGFDDWEWAVTLFAGDPLDFKALVTEMRYDEVTSVYGAFGPFRVGHRLSPHALERVFGGEPVAEGGSI
jgi:peroxiredoxin